MYNLSQVQLERTAADDMNISFILNIRLIAIQRRLIPHYSPAYGLKKL